MGVPFNQQDADHGHSLGESGLDWLDGLQPEQVSITLDAACLCRLLRNHQLHVQDFCCVDEPSKACVRQLLLDVLRHNG